MRYFKNTILLLVSVWLAGCETNVDASDLLDQQQLIVINGFLSPQDTILKVQVSKSESKARGRTNTTNEDFVIKDATVIIKDEEENEVSLIYSNSSLSYEAPATDLLITPGKKYFLATTVQGKEYTSSCIIPLEQVTGIEQSIGVDNRDDFIGNRKMKVTIEDIKEKSNYYVVGAEATYSFEGDTSGETTRDLDFEFNRFITDTNRENSVVTADGGFFLPGFAEITKVKIKVANTEEILYNALRAEFINNYNDDNPFTESVIAPTNIEGENGFGVFAGYQLTEKEITF
ncbi:DUF4249 domain-containing protein [Aquimarina algicola]|uniref:DUF4249 domain-containing protein n=1 Tax=Aquimarina algicola TaxID=2589995 RepID=A0A504JDE9_9FLAO|nr:DUF4249 domain-containing protein [Aquimarina algicola]TPN84391.1 DUF4249 domain-containing protein [Aquimarina algicola]